MRKLPFILSLIVHLGFFFLLLKSSSVSSPEPEVVEISFASPPKGQKESREEEVKVIPKGDTDAMGRQCPYTYGGIGIQQGLFDITVVFEGYAADRAGIKVGDELLSNGEIRGEPGTVVHIKVRRGKNILEFTIIREKICYDI